MQRTAARIGRGLAALAFLLGLSSFLAAGSAVAGPDEPHVLLGADAGAFVDALQTVSGSADPELTADVVVLILEPYGLVRIVLIDTAARAKRWAQVRPEALAAILARLGEGA